MDIKQSISFSAQLQAADNKPFVNFNGSVDESAVPSVNYYISNQDVYRANTKLFRDSLTTFQNTVFDAADKKATELASQASDTTVTTGETDVK
ncbi:hypothetical protein AB0X56_05540 [Weissella paramesenteroides]|uniref:Uncharacterized protein n=1 Tax=Weissella paramesenteroides ATCC 33313 TaxID=585506 RepID=C5RA56_WEIPA|nr:hypothetical protein [Weissella paramesenteroides]ATF40960.1 hypothetical protein CO680_02360 [Weissella paramesenteroides]EER74910.1 hypothetical protein HMPREF0877_0851 [Weissella paramesenteroides ATCC 33313]